MGGGHEKLRPTILRGLQTCQFQKIRRLDCITGVTFGGGRLKGHDSVEILGFVVVFGTEEGLGELVLNCFEETNPIGYPGIGGKLYRVNAIGG